MAGKLGSGERFARLQGAIARKGKAEDPGAVAAKIGMNKYGAKFQRMAAAGRRRAAKQ